MKRKKTAVVCLLLLLSLGFAIPTYAEEIKQVDEAVGISPLWQHIVRIDANLVINNGRATMDGSVIANPGTTGIIVNVALDRVNTNGTLTRITSFNNLTSSGNIWAWGGNWMVATGHTYRMTMTVTAFRNGGSETVIFSSWDVRAN